MIGTVRQVADYAGVAQGAAYSAARCCSAHSGGPGTKRHTSGQTLWLAAFHCRGSGRHHFRSPS